MATQHVQNRFFAKQCICENGILQEQEQSCITLIVLAGEFTSII